MSRAGKTTQRERPGPKPGPPKPGPSADAGPAADGETFEPAAPGRRSRKELYLNLATLAVLLGLGTYQSVRYHRHVPVPMSDFASFAPMGHELLAGRLPKSLMRAPLVGLMQAALSKAVAPWHGEMDCHPDLTAGWLLNGILHPLNVVLLWLIARRLIGRWGVWLAIAAAINPFLLATVVHPIAETPLLFFILLSFYFILRRSRWAYLFASLATMARYEGAALILVAFVVDMIHRRGRRRRLAAVGMAALAALPLALWMLATHLQWRSHGIHYFKVIRWPSELGAVLLLHLTATWHVTILPLLTATGSSLAGTEAAVIANFAKVLGAVLFLFGLGWAVYKRRWEVLALMIFLVAYVAAHVLHPWVVPRFCVPYFWIVLLLCAYGARGLWDLTDRKHRAFRIGRGALLVVLALASLYWIARLWPEVASTVEKSPNSAYMAHIALAAGAVVVGLRLALRLGRPVGRLIAVSLVAAAMILSNQFLLATSMGHGDRSREFKHLLDWYSRHAAKGELLVTTLPHTLKAMAPRYAPCILHHKEIPGETTAEFVRACWDRNVTYVAWDSRIGLLCGDANTPPDLWYTLWKMHRVRALGRPGSTGPFQFVTQIRNRATGHYINVFRLARVMRLDEPARVAEEPVAPVRPPRPLPLILRYDPNG
jgi:hypothetical protein